MDPQCKEKLYCCSWPLSHSCATCQSGSELLLRSQAGEQSFPCQLCVSVVWPFIIKAKGVPWLTWQAKRMSLSSSARVGGDQLLLETPAAPGERGLAEGCGSLCLLLSASFIASQREKHPRSPSTYCARWSPPPEHLRFVPHAACACHISQESREKTKTIKNYFKNPTGTILMFPTKEIAAYFLGTFFFLPVIIGGFSAGEIWREPYSSFSEDFGGLLSHPALNKTPVKKREIELHLFNPWPLWRLLWLFIADGNCCLLGRNRKHQIPSELISSCPALMMPVTADRVCIGGSALQIKGPGTSPDLCRFIRDLFFLLCRAFLLQTQHGVILVMSFL